MTRRSRQHAGGAWVAGLPALVLLLLAVASPGQVEAQTGATRPGERPPGQAQQPTPAPQQGAPGEQPPNAGQQQPGATQQQPGAGQGQGNVEQGPGAGQRYVAPRAETPRRWYYGWSGWWWFWVAIAVIVFLFVWWGFRWRGGRRPPRDDDREPPL